MRIGLSTVLLIANGLTAAAADPTSLYTESVKPILMTKCVSCHGALKQESGLRLDAVQLIRRGGDSGAALVAADPDRSLILQRVMNPDADLRMPPADSGQPLDDEQIAALRAWIATGATAANEEIPIDPSRHWSYRRPNRMEPLPPLPRWGQNPVDRFLHSVHRNRGFDVVGQADRARLLRRVTLDLTGIPPTPDELHAFLADDSELAWNRVIDRLLKSPRYGQRWARHWMDIWRYSDPSGYGKEIRDGRQHIWQWRDWIVDSLNEDLGYDAMIVRMLAADEAVPDDSAAQRATGFLARNWYKFNRNVWLDNIVEHSSKAFLGMTVNCSRCHDHKYDPIGQNEYYSLRAIFETHDVRDEAGQDGIVNLVRAYDAYPDRPTYPFIRGDENQPDEKQPLNPGVPSILGKSLTIQPVELPVTAWYPALRPQAIVSLRKQHEDQLAAARVELEKSQTQFQAAEKALADAPKPDSRPSRSTDKTKDSISPSAGDIVLNEMFDALDPGRWQIESGQWMIREGRLLQQNPQSVQHRILLKQAVPRNFAATVRFRITGGELYRSVGIGFDSVGSAMKGVYASGFAGGSKLQYTFQDQTARWVYPAEGTAPCSIELNRDYRLRLQVRDSLLNAWLDDQLVLACNVTPARQTGQITLFAFSSTVEFDGIEIRGLPATVALKPASQPSPVPVDPEQAFEVAQLSREVARATVALREAEQNALEARIEAEKARYGLMDTNPAENRILMFRRQASRLERIVKIKQLEQQSASQELVRLQGSGSNADDKQKKAAAAASTKLQELNKQLDATRGEVESGSTEYAALGTQYPRTSSGRRLAYARWIVDPDNPLTARVAVNQVWMRLTGRPLVERVFDFGLRQTAPEHLELLDWLAVELVESGWSMKHLIRTILRSGFYQLDSHPGPNDSPMVISDPDNRMFWRMNVRRLAAESVRDSVLFLGGRLDESQGGPPIEHTQGQTSPRRSLYFRQDKERQMPFLSLFDGANVNECYERKATVAPQQALALFNSRLSAESARILASQSDSESDEQFVRRLFETVLCRPPVADEAEACQRFLAASEASNRRRNLALVLLNHNDFVSVR